MKKFIEMKERIMASIYFVPACYGFFFLFTFFIFFHMTFPAESLKERLIDEIERSTHFRAEIENADMYPVFNFKFSGVTLTDERKGASLRIEELKLSPFMIRYIFSDDLDMPFEAKLLGGEAEGRITYSMGTGLMKSVEAKLVLVNLETVPAIMPSAFGGQTPIVQGILNGGFSIQLEPKVSGKFDFQVSNLGFSNVKVMNLTIPAFSGLESNFKGYMENGKTRIEQLKCAGDGIDVMASGTAPLLWKIKKGERLDLAFQLRLKKKELSIIKTLLASHLSPQVDGSLGGKIGGTIENPRLVKEASGSGRF